MGLGGLLQVRGGVSQLAAFPYMTPDTVLCCALCTNGMRPDSARDTGHAAKSQCGLSLLTQGCAEEQVACRSARRGCAQSHHD